VIRGRKLTFRILLAEDNPVNQQVALGLLETLGHGADAVANGIQVLEALSRIRYDVVLMDCQMPRLDGYETTRRIRQLELEGATPLDHRNPVYIIAMTANALKGDREKCLAAGMNDYLSKPVHGDELQVALDRHGQICLAGTAAPDKTPGTAGEILVDIDRLREVAHDRPDQLQELIHLYLVEAGPMLDGLGQAIRTNSSGEVARIAHEFVGCSLFCGVEAFTQPLRALERLGQQGNLSGADTLLADVRHKFPRVQSAFTQLVQTLQTSNS
jgi:CheY-like chemotaxis protein/HPt (histidine-containing phosphotransfer) domain-containing protein